MVPTLQAAHIHSGVFSGSLNMARKAPTRLETLRMTNIFQGFTGAVCHTGKIQTVVIRRGC